jgi:hypothetical protein
LKPHGEEYDIKAATSKLTFQVSTLRIPRFVFLRVLRAFAVDLVFFQAKPEAGTPQRLEGHEGKAVGKNHF